MTAATAPNGLGAGVYSFPVAARLVGRRPGTLRRWLRSGLTPPSYDRVPGKSDVMSFHDLISLEVVDRMRATGVSLQKIRLLESELRRLFPATDRPFALRAFFTDGVDVWVELEPDDHRLVEATGRKRRQLAWRDAIASFADEIVYDDDGVAAQWLPAEHVVIDPHINFGEPVVDGTRVTVATVAANLEVASVDQVADWFQLTVDQVEAAGAYASRSARVHQQPLPLTRYLSHVPKAYTKAS